MDRKEAMQAYQVALQLHKQENVQKNLTRFFASIPEMVVWQAFYKNGLAYYVSFDTEYLSMQAIENWLLYNNHQTALHRDGYKGEAVYVGQIEICDLLQKEFKGIPYHVSEIVCNQCHIPLTSEELAIYSLAWQHSGDMYCTQHELREQFKPFKPYQGMQWDSALGEYREEGKSMAWDKMLDSDMQKRTEHRELLDDTIPYEHEMVEDLEAWEEMGDRVERQHLG